MAQMAMLVPLGESRMLRKHAVLRSVSSFLFRHPEMPVLYRLFNQYGS